MVKGSEVDGWQTPCLLDKSLLVHHVLRYDTAKFDFRSAVQAALGWPHELSRLHEKPVEAASSTPPSLHRGQIQARMSGSAGRDEAKQQKSAWLQHNDGYRQLLEVFRKFVREVILPHLGCDVLFQAVPVLRCVLPGSVAPCQPHVDADYFHDASELNFWLPLTAVAGANSLYSESAPGLGDYAPFDLAYGECMRFYGNRCRHYTVANSTMTTVSRSTFA